MQKKKIKAGHVIIKYGDIGQEYYVLSKGTCQVTVYETGASPNDPNLERLVNFKKQLKTDLSAKPPLPMIGFGEIALLYNDKRTATVTAINECEAWVLSGDVYKHIIAKHSIRRRNISLEYLDKVNLFKNLETYEKLKLIDGLKVVEYAHEEYVIHEGDKGDNFYIIEKGEVQAGLEKEDGKFTLVRNLEAGSHFGEIALINNVRRTMSIRSVGHS